METLENLPLNLVDLIALLVLAVSALLGAVRGFVQEVLGIFAWIGAAMATLYGFPHLKPYFHEYISIPLLADVTTGVVIFLVVLITLSLLVRLISEKVKESSIGVLDRSLGFAFGLARGALLLSGAWLMLVAWIPKEDWPDWIEEAKSQPFLEQGGAILIALIPDHLLEEGSDALREMMDDPGNLDSLSDPLPKDSASTEESGYKADSRKAMDQVFEESSQ